MNMTANWQLVVALACVALAVAILVRRAVRLWNDKTGSGCGSGCGSCPASQEGTSAKPLVTLEIGSRDKKRTPTGR